MKTRVLFFFIIVSVGVAGMMQLFSPASPTTIEPQPSGDTIDEATREQILQATVQIAMYEHANAQGVESGGRGLGTLVRAGGETLVVTHDHWTHFNANLNEVEFRTAQGVLLLTLPAAAFSGLVRYRDGGTMLLNAPLELQGLHSTSVATVTPAHGDMVWFVRCSPADGGATVEVLAAQVEEGPLSGGPARLHLEAGNGASIAPGDSGGGVWMNGQLLGNLWSGSLQIRRTWFDRLLGREQITTTSMITAATFPAVGAASSAPQDTAVTLEAKLSTVPVPQP